jgi:hypothetical protein
MVRLTDFVLHCACRQLREWQALDPRHASLTMSVNVSGTTWRTRPSWRASRGPWSRPAEARTTCASSSPRTS